MDTNTRFCLLLLTSLRQELTKEQKAKLRTSWVYGYQRGAGDWEFQNPADGFYWNGHADNAYEARYKGISAWLEKHYPTAQDQA